MMGGVPSSGKSYVVRRVIKGQGEPNYIEPVTLFPCKRLGDTIVIGRYPEDVSLDGTYRSSIFKFCDSIVQEYSKHKHVIIEGDRVSTVKNIEWLVSGYASKVYVLQLTHGIVKQRHRYRKTEKSDLWLKSRQTPIQNTLTNLVLMSDFQIRITETCTDTQKLVTEIKRVLHG